MHYLFHIELYSDSTNKETVSNNLESQFSKVKETRKIAGYVFSDVKIYFNVCTFSMYSHHISIYLLLSHLSAISLSVYLRTKNIFCQSLYLYPYLDMYTYLFACAPLCYSFHFIHVSINVSPHWQCIYLLKSLYFSPSFYLHPLSQCPFSIRTHCQYSALYKHHNWISFCLKGLAAPQYRIQR